MKALLAIFFSIIFMGCIDKTNYRSDVVKAPSVQNVKNKIQESQNSINRATQSSNNLSNHLSKSKNFSKNIDDKAVVILKYWK